MTALAALGSDGPAVLREWKFRCLFKGSGTNRRCIRGSKPSSRCRRAGRRALFPLCGCLGHWPRPRSRRWRAGFRRREWRRGRCCGMPVSSRSMMRWSCGFRDRQAPPARTSRNFTSMAGVRCWRHCSPHSLRLRMCVPRSRANLPAAHSRMASSISPKPKVSTISFMPTPIGNAARHCVNSRVCSATRRATGARRSSRHRR